MLETEQLRTRIATDLHDDIGASLSRIAILSEVLAQRGDTKNAALVGQLSEIAGGARQMIMSMSDIVWAINPRHDHLRDLAQRMLRFASDVLSVREIEVVFQAPTDPDLKLDAETRRQVFLIFKEAITNVARHSGCKRAEIELLRDQSVPVLSVRDDGRGLDATKANAGNGLASMQMRAEMLGGKLAIESRAGMGTTIILRAPTGAKGRARVTAR